MNKFCARDGILKGELTRDKFDEEDVHALSWLLKRKNGLQADEDDKM